MVGVITNLRRIATDRRGAVLLAAFLMLGGLAAWLCLRAEAGFQERLSATAPQNADLDRIAFSDDGVEVAYVVCENGHEVVVAGNTKGRPFDEIELRQYEPKMGTALFNTVRPHSALNYLTPEEFVRTTCEVPVTPAPREALEARLTARATPS